MAGKKGHCKICGQIMSVPRAEEIASMAAMPALTTAAIAGGSVAAAPAGTPPAPIASWLQGNLSKAALAPITVDRMPIWRKKPTKPSPLDDAEDSKPYALAQPVRERGGRVKAQGNVVAMVWRRQLGGLQKLFRKINEAAYLVSVPFLMVLLLGAVVRNRPMALLGATVVILLNIGRLISGAANLAIIPFRDGMNLSKMKKPIRRVVEPAVTIGLVVLAFTFIPWLSGAKSAKGSVSDRIRSGAAGLRQEMKGELEGVADQARALDVGKVGAQAQVKLEELTDRAKNFDARKVASQAQEKLQGLKSSSSGGPPGQGIGSRIGSGLKALEKRTQEELDRAKAIEDSQKQP
jgi:hypothetical protein